jgi:hypothetical protein
VHKDHGCTVRRTGSGVYNFQEEPEVGFIIFINPVQSVGSLYEKL